MHVIIPLMATSFQRAANETGIAPAAPPPPFDTDDRGHVTLVVLQRWILRESSLKSATEAGGTYGDGEAADGGGSERSAPRHRKAS